VCVCFVLFLRLTNISPTIYSFSAENEVAVAWLTQKPMSFQVPESAGENWGLGEVCVPSPTPLVLLS
jgi:hypothetical protein